MWKVFKIDKRFKNRSERCPIYLKSKSGCKNFKEFTYKINGDIVSREAFMEAFMEKKVVRAETWTSWEKKRVKYLINHYYINTKKNKKEKVKKMSNYKKGCENECENYSGVIFEVNFKDGAIEHFCPDCLSSIIKEVPEDIATIEVC